jgi:hypothetical protein
VINSGDSLVGINVTLTSEEQLKLPTWTDVKILMTLNWKSNSNFNSVETVRANSVFQHVLFQINFSPTENKLFAALSSSTNQITKG